jgi:hypothetical protein
MATVYSWACRYLKVTQVVLAVVVFAVHYGSVSISRFELFMALH